jgi:chromate transporter
MGNRVPARPTLAALFVGFVSIGMMSFGGGLTAWMRLEVVQRRGWMDDPQFLSGYALSQLVPGATNVNLAVFIGAQLRGWSGAIAAFAGLTTLPVTIVLVVGFIYFRLQGMPSGSWFSSVLAGMGAVAIGLNLGTGIQLARRNITQVSQIAIAAAVAISVGVLGFSLVHALLVMAPLSLLAAWLSGPR